jgi:hypothetical protein
LHGRFFNPTSLALNVKTGFPVEPVNRYSTDPVPPEKYFPESILYATPAEKASHEEFFAVMQIQRLGENSQPQAKMDRIDGEGAHAVRLQYGDRTHFVISRNRDVAGTIQSEGLETDGQSAAIEMAADGTVLRAMASDARYLRYKGRLLFEENEPTNWAMPSTQRSP